MADCLNNRLLKQKGFEVKNGKEMKKQKTTKKQNKPDNSLSSFRRA